MDSSYYTWSFWYAAIQPARRVYYDWHCQERIDSSSLAHIMLNNEFSDDVISASEKMLVNSN
jgi:hypothetical protein